MSAENLNPLTQQPFSATEIAAVVKYGNDLIAIQSEIATLEAALELNQKKQFTLLTQTLPDAMKAIGMNSFQMTNGASIKIVPFYQCSVSDSDPTNKAKALKWLRTNEAGSLIKHEFKCALGVEAEKLVVSLRGFLNKKQIVFKDGQSVNAATLKSFMKERIEAGKPFPLDIFKGFTGNIAKVEMPKQ